jgi:hypothetical protein
MVKISMMPLRGLPFGVRLNARLGNIWAGAFSCIQRQKDK